jgi:hypothetical protein
VIEIGSWKGQVSHFEIPSGEPEDNPAVLATKTISFGLPVPAAAFALPADEDREIRLDALRDWPARLHRGQRVVIRMLGGRLDCVVLSRSLRRLTLRGKAIR